MKVNAEAIRIIHPLEPIYAANAKVLILGSFPSIYSRQKAMYYANPANRFWPVLEIVFHEKIIDRIDFCRRHRIALWDVVKSCQICGSSDASIRDIEVNNIAMLTAATNIAYIFTTGKKAALLYEKYVHLDLPHFNLPSTSGANAKMDICMLAEYYQKIAEVL